MVTEEKCSKIEIGVDENEVHRLSEFFKVFGDGTRLKILLLLAKRELCVHQLSDLLDMQQTAVSHQLKILRQTRLVKFRKEGKHVFYSLDDSHIGELMKVGLEHIKESL